MTIEATWNRIKNSLLDLITEMDGGLLQQSRGVEQLTKGLQMLTGTVAPTPTPAPTPVQPGAPPISELFWGEGQVPEGAWSVIDRAARICGITPEALAAIMVHESAWFTSELFKEGHNPGGIKHYPTLFAGFGIHVGKYVAADGNEYSTFEDWQEGMLAMGYFLTQTRYDGIRKTEDPAAEILAIHEAGYAEHSQDWLDNVSALCRKLIDRRHGTTEWRASTNFSYAEVVRTSHGIQTLPEELKPNAEWLATHVLEPIRKAKGTTLSIASWYRNDSVNAAVGGEPDSVHRTALAVDLAGGRTKELWQAIRDSGVLANPEVRVLVEGDHYHVAKLRPGDPRDVAGGQWLSDTAPLPFEVIS